MKTHTDPETGLSVAILTKPVRQHLATAKSDCLRIASMTDRPSLKELAEGAAELLGDILAKWPKGKSDEQPTDE